MAIVLGVNAVFHDPAAAIVVDGEIVAAAEEERFSRRKHGKPSVPFSTWEVPQQAAMWCLEHAGIGAEDLDAVSYSYDPNLAPPSSSLIADGWEGLRTLYARRAPRFLATALPGLDPAAVRFVPHHIAHAASAYLAAPVGDSAVMVHDGRGESSAYLAGSVRDGELEALATQSLPHSLGLLYESLTEHLGFARASDEYKVMALAAYGEPRWLDELRRAVRVTGDGRFEVAPIEWRTMARARRRGEEEWTADHADLAASVQRRLEEVLLELAGWLQERTGQRTLTMAGGVALNCVANTRLLHDGPFDEVWVQPAAGDAGTALGGALYLAHAAGDRVRPMAGAGLGRGWDDAEIERRLTAAGVPFKRPIDVGDAVARILAADGIVAWFEGRAEYGPRALGHRSLLADPRNPRNTERLNLVKGREQFRPIAPMVLEHRAEEIFGRGPIPSPYMLFTHDVRPDWRDRIPAVVHVDGTARIQTVRPDWNPSVAGMLEAFDRRTGVPVVINTSLNTAGRPIVDDPRDALELFGAAPADAMVMGPFLIRRESLFQKAAA